MVPVSTDVTHSAPDQQRETLLQLAKLSEYTERYDDMAKFMKQLVEFSDGVISSEERNLLSVAYKQVVSALRNAFRVMSSMERSETVNASAMKKQILADYEKTIKKEVLELCTEAIGLLDKFLIGVAASVESKIFFLKMKGDYCRYIAEVSDADGIDEVTERSRKAYQEAFDIAKEKMTATDPIRLGLALNFSVFHYEIAKATREAIDLAKQSFDEAVVELENLSEDAYKDSTCIMQLLRDNLTLWTTNAEEQSSDGGEEVVIPTTSIDSIAESGQKIAMNTQEDAEQTVPTMSIDNIVESGQKFAVKMQEDAEQPVFVDSTAVSDNKEGEKPQTPKRSPDKQDA